MFMNVNDLEHLTNSDIIAVTLPWLFTTYQSLLDRAVKEIDLVHNISLLRYYQHLYVYDPTREIDLGHNSTNSDIIAAMLPWNFYNVPDSATAKWPSISHVANTASIHAVQTSDPPLKPCQTLSTFLKTLICIHVFNQEW